MWAVYLVPMLAFVLRPAGRAPGPPGRGRHRPPAPTRRPLTQTVPSPFRRPLRARPRPAAPHRPPPRPPHCPRSRRGRRLGRRGLAHRRLRRPAPRSAARPPSPAPPRSRSSFTDDGCTPVAGDRRRAGPTNFEITTTAPAAVTEAEVMQGDRILGEKENLTPGPVRHVQPAAGRRASTSSTARTPRTDRSTLTVTAAAGAAPGDQRAPDWPRRSPPTAATCEDRGRRAAAAPPRRSPPR